MAFHAADRASQPAHGCKDCIEGGVAAVRDGVHNLSLLPGENFIDLGLSMLLLSILQHARLLRHLLRYLLRHLRCVHLLVWSVRVRLVVLLFFVLH